MTVSAPQVYQILRTYKARDAAKILSKVTGQAARRFSSWPTMEESCSKLDTIHLQSLLEEMDSTPSTRAKKPYKRVNTTVARILPTPPEKPHPTSSNQHPTTSAAADSIDPTSPDSNPSSDYLKCVSRETVEGCVVDFIERTNNAAMAQGVCVSCARRLFVHELQQMQVSEIPNSHHLRPHRSHPGHSLSCDGLLLAAGTYEHSADVSLCGECLNRLDNDRRPKMALANGLWVGEVPPELQALTLPERVLISLYFPVAYVVKLYPSGRRTYNTAHDRLHSALKGNVSTYKLDQQQIADMLGMTMPPPAKILSSTIAITYVGPNNLPKKSLRGSFRVRRAHVSRALHWLKANNPLYRNIEISEVRLSQLPLDGVPPAVGDTARWSTDVGALDREHGSYVPLLNDDDDEDALERMADADDMLVDDMVPDHLDGGEGVLNRSEAGVDYVPEGSEVLEDATTGAREAGVDVVDEHGPSYGDGRPPVIPLQSHGVIDIAGHDIPNDELFTHALANTAGLKTIGEVPKYNIRHSTAFVNEYARRDPVTGLKYDGGPDNPNHLLGTFPYLFPYGQGGFETDQHETVTYESHAQWAMQYYDRRFRTDLHFVFQVFGVIQKREVCRSASLQITGAPDFIQNRLRSLTLADFVQAVEEEARKVPFSNQCIRALRSQMSAIRARVTGTDESRHSLRSKIWSTNTICNTPSLWITINPPDTQSPVAQVLVGEEIDLDAFCNTAGPDSNMRAVNIAADPFAAAQYFHHTIESVLEGLLGIRKSGTGAHRITRKEGIFGTVQAYIGTVEAQGRGTLHLHLLVWLKDTPRPGQYRDALATEEFRQKVATFIQQNIHAGVDDMGTKDFFLMKKDPEISYARPLDPRDHNYAKLRIERTKKAVRSLQFHVCKDGVCKVFKRGAVTCKRGAPWALARDAWVSEAGYWGPKRSSAYVNNFNPTFIETLVCNHDAKVLIHGAATRPIAWYITNYTGKKQGHTSNSSALLAKRYAYFEEEEKLNPEYHESNKRLLQRCANSLSRDREFSAPEVISYLMKWGDRYESHFYVNIYWEKAYKHLVASFPGLKSQSSRHFEISGTGWNREQAQAAAEEPEPESYSLQFVGGTLEMKNQLQEYACRGLALENESYLKVFLDTYDSPYTPETDLIQVDPTAISAPPRPRMRHERIPYLPSYGNAKRCRIRRAATHETLPRFVGRWFPRANDPVTHELYCASMLLLLKPWRTLADLKDDHQTFSEVFTGLMAGAGEWVKTVVENIQNYYDCADQAKADETDANNSMTYSAPLEEDLRQQHDIVLPSEMDPTAGLTEGDVDLAYTHRHTARERDFLDLAMMVAHNAGIHAPQTHDISIEPVTRQTVPDMLPTILEWESQLKAITREPGAQLTKAIDTSNAAAVLEATTVRDGAIERHPAVTETLEQVRQVPEGGLKSILNAEQRRAHDIIVGVIENDLKGVPQEQLLMIVQGQGGTGKTLLIQAITESLKKLDAAQYLGKSATSGIAASPIGGTTVHSYFGIPAIIKTRDWVTSGGKDIKQRRQKNLAQKRVVFIDEMSMLTKGMLCNASQVAQTVKGEHPETASNSTLPFGGLHVVLFGDLHQFPPVGGEALYIDIGNERAALGRAIYLQFRTVVILREQNRSKDPGWTDILGRVRVGECTDEDVDEINKLSILDPRCNVPDFNDPEWSQALLVTPRHSLREEWNKASLRKFCRENGLRRYEFPAIDIDTFTGEKPRLDYRINIATMNTKATGRLPGRIEIAKGMKIMVLVNVATEADVANGTRGVIEDFWLDPDDEPVEQPDGTISLTLPPAVIFFKPDLPAAARFDGVPEGVIPLTPTTMSFDVLQDRSMKNCPKIKVKRRQYAITGAYAFTDYKSQGQTIEKVIIDLVVPNAKDGVTQGFNAYVALSRGRGRDSIRLLRPIPASVLTKHPSEALRTEMERLERLDAITKMTWEQALQSAGTQNSSSTI